ncbi:hypothetical protein [Lelliottia wanjuensis]|uniref:hypothetical protein n=1 Tax=Lelliottia wanjuensis TaxID=3050585 RepID=UPI0025506F5A|nr:hypothetical protein [Lelliottia sp. V86_10]MDK9586711.1 hypothetical protein [Lelliottia sp. V86_10]
MRKLGKDILRALVGLRSATCETLAPVVEVEKRQVSGAIAGLVKSGYVQRIDGKRGNYVYALIKSPALDAVLAKPDEPEQPQGPSIFDQCRTNWKGYEFHQIIGSTSRRLTA